MSYRSLHKTEERFELAVLALVLVAFFVAIALMFIHPTASLTVFALGLIGTGSAVVVVWSMKVAERRAARRELQAHQCPECGAEINHVDGDAHTWRCGTCEAVFTDAGRRAFA